MSLFLLLVGVLQSQPLQLQKLEFHSLTNKSFISVHGVAEIFQGNVKTEGLDLKALSFSIPAESLKTGLSLRDRHMRERIFKTEDGKFPAIEFDSQQISCKRLDALQSDCLIKGLLSIRGLKKQTELSARLKVSGERQLSGSSILKLSTWGISQPEQLGVQVKDEVTITYEAKF